MMPTDERDVLTELAACRPDLTDVALEPDERLLTRILDSPVPPVRRTSPRVAVLAAIGTAAAAAIVAVTLIAPGSTPDRADALVRDAVNATATAVADGGLRIVGTAAANGEAPIPFEHTIDGSGNWNLDVVLPSGVTVTNRVVGGELYVFDGSTWTREIDQTDSPTPTPGSPHVTTMLAALDGDAGFETVGTEQLDGAPATHLQAATPTTVDARAIGYNALLLADGDDPAEQVVTALDLWVADDLVRRIDIAVTQTRSTETVQPDGSLVPGEPWVENIEISMTVHDAGQSVTIDAPTDYDDVDSAG
jgi:hypothetical protein